jgi:hypothetical protein
LKTRFVLVHPAKLRVTTCFYGNPRSIAARQKILANFYKDSLDFFNLPQQDKEKIMNHIHVTNEEYCLCAINHNTYKLKIFVLFQPNLMQDEIFTLTQETMEKLKKNFVI